MWFPEGRRRAAQFPTQGRRLTYGDISPLLTNWMSKRTTSEPQASWPPWVFAERAPRFHYAVAVAKVRGGWRVERAVQHLSRGEADKHSLTLFARYGDAEAITLDRPIAEGDVLDAALLKR